MSRPTASTWSRVFATRTHFDYHDPRAVAEARAAGSTRCGHRPPGACTRPICDGFAAASGDARSRTRRPTPPAGRRRWTRRAPRSTPPGSSAAGASSSTSACRAVRRSRRATTTLGAHAAQPRGDRRGGTAVGRALALEVIPNDLSRRRRWSTGSTATSSSATPAVCLDFGHAHMLVGRRRRPPRRSRDTSSRRTSTTTTAVGRSSRAVRGDHRLAGHADGDVEDRLRRAARLRGRRSRRRGRRAAAGGWRARAAFRRYWMTWTRRFGVLTE